MGKERERGRGSQDVVARCQVKVGQSQHTSSSDTEAESVPYVSHLRNCSAVPFTWIHSVREMLPPVLLLRAPIPAPALVLPTPALAPVPVPVFRLIAGLGPRKENGCSLLWARKNCMRSWSLSCCPALLSCEAHRRAAKANGDGLHNVGRGRTVAAPDESGSLSSDSAPACSASGSGPGKFSGVTGKEPSSDPIPSLSSPRSSSPSASNRGHGRGDKCVAEAAR